MAIKIKMASILFIYLFIYLKSYVVTLLANSLVIVSCPENQPTNLFKLIHIFCIQRIDVSFLFVCPLVDDKLLHDIVKLPMEPQAGGRVDFDNVMTQFSINKRTDE